MSVLRQALHVFAKDLRRFWAELLVVYALLGLAVATLDPGTTTSTILSGLLLPVGILLFTAMVVQEDGPGDGRAFWITRPLDAGGVLLAKAIFVGVLLVAVPVAAHVAAAAALAAADPPARILLGALVVFGGLVAVAAGVASVTRGLQSFVVAGLGIGVAFIVGRRLTFSGIGLERGEATTATFLLSAGWLVVGGATLAHQYFTRRHRRTLALGAVAAVAILLVVPRLGLDLSPPATPEPERVEIPAEGLDFTIEGLSLERRAPGLRPVRGDEPRLAAGWLLTGAGVLHADLREVSTVARGPGLERSWSGPAATLQMRIGQHVHLPGLVRLDGRGRSDRRPPERADGQSTLLVATSEELRRLARQVESLDVTAAFDAYRWVVLGSLPLEEDATLRTADGLYRIEESDRDGPFPTILLEHRVVRSALTPAPEPRGLEEPGVLLLNRERKEYVVGRPGSGTSSGPGPMLGGLGSAEEERRFSFGDPPTEPGEAPMLDEAWVRGAEVALLGREYVGSFSKRWSGPVEMPRTFDRYVRVPPPAAPGRGRPESPAPPTP